MDERDLGQAFERGQTRNFSLLQSHLARPSAAGRAALALVKHRHGRRMTPAIGPAKTEPDEIV
jgi:hypothetical protein